MLLLASLLLLSPQDSPEAWVSFASRETEKAPRLVVDGKELTATADTVLISYLAERAFGALPSLSISLGDTNRALLRFDLAGITAVGKAELVLELALSQKPPHAPFELALHAVTGEWGERTTSWTKQPAFAEAAGASRAIVPKAGPVRIDVTELARGWLASNHGCLLKVARALVGPEGRPDLALALERRLLASLPFAESTEAALARAKEQGRPVLAFVMPDEGGKPVLLELMLLAALTPPLRALVAERFVPVRVAVPAALCLGRDRAGDPLQALGTAATKAKAPALVVCSAAGEHVATLASIGTVDHDLIGGFLRAAAKLPAGEAAAATEPESLYWRGVALFRAGKPAEAEAAWRKVEGPWSLDAEARLVWPERLAIYQPQVRCTPVAGTTEVASAERLGVERGLEYLLATQLSDGTWPLAAAEAYRAAVTALAARALHQWLPRSPEPRRARMAAALARATEWMRRYLENAAPEHANSWGAAYLLDYFVDRASEGGAFAATATKAAAFLAAGQLQSGAWSYDKTFGTGWKGGFGGWPKTDQGRAHSMNTAPALIALARARDAGIVVEAKALERGRQALLAMRDAPGVFTYTWPEPRSFAKKDQSIGRAPACEHALLLLKATERRDLELAVEEFLRFRTDLRATAKLTAAWIGPHATSAYFWAFAYYHAARAIRDLGGEQAEARLAQLRGDVLLVAEADGSWLDFADVGKPYATAMALMVLR